MAAKLDNLGYARVFRHPRTGELVVDTDSLRRPSGFGGVDIGEDDDFGEDDDDFGEDDFGARGQRRRRRLQRRVDHNGRRGARLQRRLDEPAGGRRGNGGHDWGMTAVGGTDALPDAGAATVKIRLQHDFRAQDVTFTGSASGAKVTSIFFGDRVVWSNSDGIDVGVFGSSSFLRGLLKGQSLRAGLDITVNGSLTGAGDFAVTLIGQKPITPDF